MVERAYDQVKAVVFDPVAGNLQATRGGLFELGFRDIDATRNFQGLCDRLSGGTSQLVIAEAFTPEGDVLGAVRRVRGGELGPNPFVAIVLTSWRSDVGDIRQAINSGADDVLLRPFSTAKLSERIAALVAARKGFVVTGDYIGPDRRKQSGERPSARVFEPPNTLKAAAEGDFQAVKAMDAEISAKREDMDKERIKRLAMRVATAARLRLEQGGEADLYGLEEIDRAARELRRRLRQHEVAEANELAAALTEATGQLVGEGSAGHDQIALARDLAFGAYSAFAGDAEGERSQREVTQVVASLRARMRQGLLAAKAGSAA